MGTDLTWMQALWRDEAGVVLSTELVLMGSVLATGMVVGLASLRDTVTAELSDVARALSGISQAYSFSGLQGCSAEVAGSHVPSSGVAAEEEAAVMPQSCINVEAHDSVNREMITPDALPFSI